jgi:hypothetical protein
MLYDSYPGRFRAGRLWSVACPSWPGILGNHFCTALSLSVSELGNWGVYEFKIWETYLVRPPEEEGVYQPMSINMKSEERESGN